MKTRYRLFLCRTPVRQLPYVSNVLILSYWKVGAFLFLNQYL